jgi:uncharacterized protein (TIGR02466 family)
MSAVPSMSFNGVWPTMLIKRQPPGFEEANAGLEAHIAQQEAREKDYTARYQEQNFFASDDKPVLWLRDQTEQTAKAFLRQYGIDRPLSWSLFAWYNINRLGDHHAPHTHPRSYLSGTYYVRMPSAQAKVDDPNAKSACISFYDPRNGANMISAGAGPDARPAHTLLPAAGTLLMWPSPLQHQVHPNLTEEQRITISYNLILENYTGRK